MIIEDPNDIDIEALQKLQETGMAYVKLPGNILANLEIIRRKAISFFHQPEEHKKQYPFDGQNGYINHKDTKLYDVQRYVFRETILAPEFQPLEHLMIETREFFRHELSTTILRAIFANLGFSDQVTDLFDNPDYTLSIIYYPSGDFAPNRLGAHKDIPLINVLWAPQAGLEAKINGNWQVIEPQPGCVTIQLGQLLEAMTNGACHATEHRVILNSNVERLSLASFFAPADNIKFKNLVTGEMITNNYQDFAQARLSKFYDG